MLSTAPAEAASCCPPQAPNAVAWIKAPPCGLPEPLAGALPGSRLRSSCLVPTARLELAQLSPLPPQDSVSTNFTTSAGGETILPGAGFQALRNACFAVNFIPDCAAWEPSLGNRFKPCILPQDCRFVQRTSAKSFGNPAAERRIISARQGQPAPRRRARRCRPGPRRPGPKPPRPVPTAVPHPSRRARPRGGSCPSASGSTCR